MLFKTPTRSVNQINLVGILIIAVVVSGCGLMSSDAGDAEMVFAATEVGAPHGDKVTKEIGPAGGSLVSPDGRMTLNVPKNALAEPVRFSIQPITNKAGNGIGLAYRLEPDGKTFTTPLDISVRYDDQDLEGTVVEALSIAFQDGEGAWHSQKLARLDLAAKTLTVSTTHFTDFAFLSRLRFGPAESTVYVGQSEVVGIIECKEQTFIDKIRSRPADCKSAPKNVAGWTLRGEGTIEKNPHGTGVTYTAPSKKPTPNIAWVMLTVDFEVWDPETGAVTKVSRSFASKITIIDYGWRATGQDGPTSYSGVICSLNEPFTVIGTNGPLIYTDRFTPDGSVAGTATLSAQLSGVKWAGNGPYVVEGYNTDKPRIVWQVTTTACGGGLCGNGAAPAHIDLVPIETGECN